MYVLCTYRLLVLEAEVEEEEDINTRDRDVR